MNLIKSYIRKQSFNPDITGLLVNPFYFARKNLYKFIKEYAGELNGRLLDVGCGRKPYQHLFENCYEYIGMDIENSGHDHSNENIDVYYDGTIFPFTDESFDSVLTNQVFEHVFNPEVFISEIHRVLKPGGKLLLTVPFMWDEHEQPYEFGRYTSFGVNSILEKNGFMLIGFKKSTTGFAAIAQLTMGYIFKFFYSKNSILNALGLILMFPLTLVLFLFSLIAPPSRDIYLDNIVLAYKK